MQVHVIGLSLAFAFVVACGGTADTGDQSTASGSEDSTVSPSFKVTAAISYSGGGAHAHCTAGGVDTEVKVTAEILDTTYHSPLFAKTTSTGCADPSATSAVGWTDASVTFSPNPYQPGGSSCGFPDPGEPYYAHCTASYWHGNGWITKVVNSAAKVAP